jgi:hypothetical protein
MTPAMNQNMTMNAAVMPNPSQIEAFSIFTCMDVLLLPQR